MAGEILANKLQSVHMPYAKYIFRVSVNIGKENFAEYLTILQIC